MYEQVVATKYCQGDIMPLGNIIINKRFILLEINVFLDTCLVVFICDREIGLNAEFNKYCSSDFSRGVWKINIVVKRGR